MRTRHSLRRTLEKTLRPYLQKLRQQAQATPAGIRKQMLLCISASLLLTILVFFLGLQDGVLKEGFRLPRSGYGGSKQYITLEVSGLTEDTSVPLDITVSPKRYTEEEANAVFREIYDQLEELVVAEGESFANLQHDLRLMTKLPKYGVQLSSDFTTEDEGSLGDNMLSLPTEIDGLRIYYSEHEDRSYLLLPLLGVIAAMAIYMRQGQARRTEKKQREALLMLDYSELVSKLMVYIGAGLTVRKALETISQHFDALIARSIKEDRPLYQELRTMVIQFRRNMPESEIYLSFGRRVNLKPYTKLVSLIEQNRMNGARNLRAMLELEIEDAFEQPKTTARRLGEEAGTKLLLPLFIMLGIVMIIVIVPAMSALG